MQNNFYYIFHDTLTAEHLDLSLWSISQQSEPFNWSNFIIYNSCSTISNKDIISKYYEYGLNKQFLCVSVYEHENSLKTTYSDLNIALQHAKNADCIYLFKGDYALSVNVAKTINKICREDPGEWIWTLPVYNSKQKTSIEEIKTRLLFPKFIPTDEITATDGGEHNVEEEAILPKIIPLAGQTKFISHNIICDTNTHLVSKTAREKLTINGEEINLNWGVILSWYRAKDAGVRFLINWNAFVIHYFHGIPNERGGRRHENEPY